MPQRLHPETLYKKGVCRPDVPSLSIETSHSPDLSLTILTRLSRLSILARLRPLAL